jgi:signal transduction histidine kinase
VLASPFVHYGNELRLVAAASRRLVEKLVQLDHQEAAGIEQGATAARGSAMDTGTWYPISSLPASNPSSQPERNQLWDLMPAEPIDNLAEEVVANRNLLSSLAGPAVALTVDTEAGALPVRLTGEDLTRVLINLVKNAAEALPTGGRILISLHERRATAGDSDWLVLTVEDNGPGIPKQALETIFASGYTVPASGVPAKTAWPSTHRGLGLAITRSIVEAAGGRISAANRAQGGARFEIELPART